jgi:predicted amino acid racemase
MCPRLQIDLDKIRCNTEQIVSCCGKQNISILGVTKGFSAIGPIVRAMVEGGVSGLADSRLENIIEMRDHGFHEPITLLRIPRLSNVHMVVQYADVSINSELSVMQALAEEAYERGRVHQIILMIDVGDLREGVLREHALRVARQVIPLKGARLVGLGTNMGCFGGVLPSPENLGLLVELTELIEDKLNYQLDVVSGGGTSSLLLVENKTIPGRINQLRIGEGILLGTDTTNERIIPGLYTDAFTLWSEIVELKRKPSVPIGEIGRDAFGNIPQFEDMGKRRRAILALGRQDVNVDGIWPLDPGAVILGASSDHLIVDVTDCQTDLKVGNVMSFGLTYSGLLSACQSRYVAQTFVGGPYDRTIKGK